MWALGLLKGIGPAIFGAAMALLAIFGLRKDAAKDAKQKVETDHLREQEAKREEAHEAIADEKEQTAGADNRAVLDRLRSRDRDWR